MTTTRTGVRGALALTATAVTFGLAACGGSGSDTATSARASTTSSSASSPSTSSSSTSSSSTSSPSTSSSSSVSGAATSTTQLATRVAAASKAKGTAHLTSTSSGASTAKSVGAVRFRGSGADFSATTTVPGSGRSVRMVVVRGVAYMNVGQAYQGKNWLRITPGGSDPLSKALGPVLTQLSTSLDIKSQLAALEGAKITATERTTVGGAPATKYTIVSSEKALMAQLQKFATTPQLRKTLAAQFKGAHGESVMWVGDDDLPLRVDSRVVGGSAPAATTTVTYSDWGKPVTITAPPASDVADLGA